MSTAPGFTFDGDRLKIFLEALERLAAGDTQVTLDVSSRHDELDAIAFAVNVLAQELRWAHGRVMTSERNKADALRDELAHMGRLAMLEALAGSLATDINQPLTAVMANAEAALRLLATQPPRLDDVRDTLNEILRDNRRVAEVLQRVRNLINRRESRYEPLEINDVVSEVLKLIHANAGGRRIELDVQLASDLDRVLGDRIQIQQIVLNLLLNAFDAVDGRETARRRVGVRTARRDLAIVVEVSDSGDGLPDEMLARIFDPFYTTKEGGIGLGLSICRTLVAAHGGTLQPVRNPGYGMTFVASFPAWRWLEMEFPQSTENPKAEGV